jgi:hypothetical protein
MAAGHRDMIAAQTYIILQPPNVFGRHKTWLEQAVSMEGGLPLAIFHVGLATGQVFHVLTVDYHHFQSPFLQHFIWAQPINARCLHGHRPDSLRQQIVPQLIELPGRGPKYFGRSPSDREMQLFTAHINGGSLRIKH